MSRATKRQERRRIIRRRIVLVAATFTMAAVVYLAWSWHNQVPMKRVVVSGTINADSSEVIRFAALEADSVGLFALESDVLIDRVRRTPWVRDAVIRRRASGTLSIRVEEREPVVLVVREDGRPSHYLDAEGYAMPLAAGASYDVPLLRGSVPEATATHPVQSASIRELIRALAETDLETNALVSEILLGSQGTVTLRTSPGGGHGSIPVLLGGDHHAEKLDRLRAFWNEAVLSRPERNFHSIDLRFEGQIVTREDSTTTAS